jgi:hypothetical protein
MRSTRRILRWLRLVVACLAFVITPAPALATEALDQVVFVEEARETSSAEAVPADQPATIVARTPAPAFDSPRLVSRLWLSNCALLL